MRAHLALAFGLLTLLHARPSHSQSRDSDIDRMFEEGRSLREQRRDAEALEVFRRLYDATRQPRALAQVGLAEAALSRWREAEVHLTEALVNPDPWVVQNLDARARIRAAMQIIRQHLASLNIVCSVRGAEVRVDDQVVGTTPLVREVRIEVGDHTIRARADGYEPVSQSVHVANGGTSEPLLITLDLRREVLPEAPRVSVSTTLRTSPRPDDVAPHRDWHRVAGWISVAGSGAFAALGVVAMVVGDGAASRWNDNSRCLLGAQTREEQCSDARATTETMRSLAITGFVGAGVFGAAAAVFFLTAPRGAPTRAAILRCAPEVGTLGLTCGGRF